MDILLDMQYGTLYHIVHVPYCMSTKMMLSMVAEVMGFHYSKLELLSFSFVCLQAISKHFRTIRVSEKKAVPLFISMVKSHKSKLDQPKPLDP